MAKKEERLTRAAPSTPAKGPTEQHKAGAPFRERGPSTASVDRERNAQVGGFEGSSDLTHARQFKLFYGLLRPA